MFLRLIITGCLIANLCIHSSCISADSMIGNPVAPFALQNAYGKSVALSDFEDTSLVVLAFLGTECPLAKLYSRRLDDLHQQYREKGVKVIGIDSNKQDSIAELEAFVRRQELTFPVLKDVGNRLADVLKVERTPEVFLLDRDRVVRYHGRIDDQYGVGYSRSEPNRMDLQNAVDALLAGNPVEVPETEVVGCHIGRVKPFAASGEITFNKHIAPIFNTRCVSCHRDGEIGPFSLTRYDDVIGWEDTIAEVVSENRMPPWSANPAHGEFSNDARLSDEEKLLITRWIESGLVEGAACDLPSSPTFIAGWQIDEPDQVIEMRDNAFKVPAEGLVDYQRFVVDPGWKTDKFIRAAEARPDNRSVVHHILVYVIPPGSRGVDLRQVLVGYAPGGLPVDLPEGVALHVPANSKLLFEMHYTPNGYAQEDLSYAGVCFVEPSTVKKRYNGRIAINTDFEIPPGAAGHVVQASYRVKADELLIAMTPHMHLRGKAFRYEAIYPGGGREILLDVPRYDFNWQMKYQLASPKKLPRGSVIECTATFDNSKYNLSNPDPNREVRWGDQSFDEMMIGFMDTVPVD